MWQLVNIHISGSGVKWMELLEGFGEHKYISFTGWKNE
jgi:hypothetical protein